MLRINQFIFSWYYKRVPEHFRQWTFVKSVKLLIQNYEHQSDWLKSEQRLHRLTIQDADSLRKQLQAYQWNELGADPSTTMRLNNMFGTDMPAGNEN